MALSESGKRGSKITILDDVRKNREKIPPETLLAAAMLTPAETCQNGVSSRRLPQPKGFENDSTGRDSIRWPDNPNQQPQVRSRQG